MAPMEDYVTTNAFEWSADEKKSYALELVAKLSGDIAREEMKFRELRARLEGWIDRDDERLREQIDVAHSRMLEAIRPMREMRDRIVRELSFWKTLDSVTITLTTDGSIDLQPVPDSSNSAVTNIGDDASDGEAGESDQS
ncbi:hypothetical protein ACVIKP_003333 [Rhizobium leguminosarum]